MGKEYVIRIFQRNIPRIYQMHLSIFLEKLEGGNYTHPSNSKAHPHAKIHENTKKSLLQRLLKMP